MIFGQLNSQVDARNRYNYYIRLEETLVKHNRGNWGFNNTREFIKFEASI